MAAETIPIYFYVANRARSYNRERAIGNSVANGNDSRRSLIVILFSIVADKLSAISSRRTQLGGRFGRRAFREKRSLMSHPLPPSLSLLSSRIQIFISLTAKRGSSRLVCASWRDTMWRRSRDINLDTPLFVSPGSMTDWEEMRNPRFLAPLLTLASFSHDVLGTNQPHSDVSSIRESYKSPWS